MIECSRGTNRVEAFHKNLNVTFGGWHVGVVMSIVLLAENRHRHNQRCAERRIDGQPMIGHYDTWLIDLLQQLVQKITVLFSIHIGLTQATSKTRWKALIRWHCIAQIYNRRWRISVIASSGTK